MFFAMTHNQHLRAYITSTGCRSPAYAPRCYSQCPQLGRISTQAVDKRQTAADDASKQQSDAAQQQAKQQLTPVQDEKQQMRQPSMQGAVQQYSTSQQSQKQHGLYFVPWDVWDFIRVTAAVWVINMAIPFAVLSSAASLQRVELQALPVGEKEVLNLLCQFLQLGSTFTIINSSISKHQPLPEPWFLIDVRTMPVFQALATAIAAVGSGVLLDGFMTGHVDGSEEWHHLAGLHRDDVGTFALVLGAIVLAPAIEEYYFRGYVLPSLTKWTHPAIAVVLTGLLFASAHPADSFLPEALLGCILSLSLLAADGNLLVPLLAHSLYNTFVLGTEFLL